MKKYAIVAAVLVLTVSLLSGCGCTNKDSGMMTMPATQPILPTNIPETTAPTQPQTEPMTIPETDPTGTSGTDESGPMNGDMQDDNTAETGAAAKSRMR